jgi:putative PIN family toxin of toxin-antitoxin system
VRVFLDTNVLVSAFASRGLCAEVLELVLLDHALVLGRNVLREFEKVLREKIKLADVRSAEIINFVLGEAIEVVDNAEPAVANVDAADALVLGEALAGQAQSFITGDAALLRLAAIGALKIVSPRQFWETLRAGDG